MAGPSDSLLALLRRWEGFPPNGAPALVPYLCPAGFATIGFGAIHTFDGTRVTLTHRPITEAGALQLLARDALLAERAVWRLCPIPLTLDQLTALTSFTFNLGAGALQASTLRQRLLRGDAFGAAEEFPRWVYAGGRKLRGLALRRAEEREIFLRLLAEAGRDTMA